VKTSHQGEYGFIILFSRQSLIIVEDRASSSSHAPILFALVTGKGGHPTSICVVVGATNMSSMYTTYKGP
jgi:hypothetical protein